MHAVCEDWLDGYLARRWKQQSALGALLDPLAATWHAYAINVKS